MINLDKFNSTGDLIGYLHSIGCKECSLGFQDNLNGCCVSRGNAKSRRMIIGEAPGKTEDALSLPFTGPAGQLLDKIFSSVGWDTNKDWYLTNVVLCRPIAPQNTGKQNFTPKNEQKKKCRPFLDKQIDLIEPKIIVALGRVALEAITGIPNIKIGDYRGKLLLYNGMNVFVMLHPAAMLHTQDDIDKYKLYRKQTWDDIRKLREIIDKENL